MTVSELKRYFMAGDDFEAIPDATGKWVRFDDAQFKLAALREELAKQVARTNDYCSKLTGTEQRLTAAEQRNAALAQQASKAFESAARWVESRRDDYVNDHGSVDPETGAVEFPGNGEEYVGELDEIAEGLRSLKPTESGASE